MSENKKLLVPQGGRNFKLRRCYDFARTPILIPSVEEDFSPIRDAFVRNVMRQYHVFLMILMSSNHAAQTERCLTAAEYQIDQKFSINMNVTEPSLAVYSQYVTNFKESIPNSKNDIQDEAAQYQIDQAFSRFEMASLSSVPAMRIGGDALLASQLLGAWTAFETMASDLWEAALNVHPATLASLKGDSKRLLTGSDAARSQSTEKKPTVSIYFLEMYQYDVAKRMGSILRQNKFSFDSLAGIREAYATAFSTNTVAVDKALSNQSLDSLVALRNVITHRASVADKIYEQRATYLPIPKIKVGEPVVLDGDVVIPLVENTLKSGFDLLCAVSEWIKAN